MNRLATEGIVPPLTDGTIPYETPDADGDNFKVTFLFHKDWNIGPHSHCDKSVLNLDCLKARLGYGLLDLSFGSVGQQWNFTQ